MNAIPVMQTLALDVVKRLRSLVVPELREVGDVRRNAAVFLARRAGDRRSSFERNLRPAVDAARLTEVPYLSSLGYLLAVRLLGHVPEASIKQALGAVTRRAPHTAERTGYADDAMCVCGLLLLARALNECDLVERLRESLTETSFSDVCIAAIVAATVGEPVRATTDLTEDVPEHVAAALLVHRVGESLGRKSFPGLPADLEAHLLRSVTSPAFNPSADFSAMVVLAALEASLSLPDEDVPASDGRCDVGIVVALKEEFRVVFDRFERRHTHVEDGGRSYYIFDVPTTAASRPYRCVATLVGDMGTNRTGVIVEKMLGRWDPSVVAIVGIAGGIHDDVRLGDVIIASEVNNYLEGAKAADLADRTEFRRAGDSFKTNHALLERIRNFEFANRATFHAWERTCIERRKALGGDGDTLLGEGILREVPAQREGHLASGPLVVVSKEFATWIRGGDRSCLGIEMEAAGLMIATHMDPGRCDALVIRGVSDLGDERKSKLDGIGGGAVRRYAMENATDFLWGLMAAGVISRSSEEAQERTPTASKHETAEASLLRVFNEHADANGEVTATWREIRSWLPGTSADLHAVAIHLKDDGYFRSHTFEGGMDGICNVVLRR
jgi:nucleoside phosphorylase